MRELSRWVKSSQLTVSEEIKVSFRLIRWPERMWDEVVSFLRLLAFESVVNSESCSARHNYES